MEQQNEVFDSIRGELKRLTRQSENYNSNFSKPSNLNEQINRTINSVTYPQLIEPSSKSKIDKLDVTSSYSIDDDIQKMRLELNKSCKLFQVAGEAFESINFKSLKHRIRDLHLTSGISEMEEVLHEKSVDQGLNKLTDIMGHKFRQHPGEFGDIPELSCFFKACSQLQHGLEELKRHRCEMDDLGKKINWSMNLTRQRINEIEDTIKKEDT